MSKTPKSFRKFLADYPAVGNAYQELSAATFDVGPLDPKTAQLMKFGIAVGMMQEGAVHAHTRKALEQGWTADELRHAVIMATTTLGFAKMMAAKSWVEDELRKL